MHPPFSAMSAFLFSGSLCYLSPLHPSLILFQDSAQLLVLKESSCLSLVPLVDAEHSSVKTYSILEHLFAYIFYFLNGLKLLRVGTNPVLQMLSTKFRKWLKLEHLKYFTRISTSLFSKEFEAVNYKYTDRNKIEYIYFMCVYLDSSEVNKFCACLYGVVHYLPPINIFEIPFTTQLQNEQKYRVRRNQIQEKEKTNVNTFRRSEKKYQPFTKKLELYSKY